MLYNIKYDEATLTDHISKNWSDLDWLLSYFSKLISHNQGSKESL